MFLEIENLARHKSFSALSAAEREQVLTEMSETEYEKLYKLIHGMRGMQAEIQPPQALKAKILQQAALQRNGRPRWKAALWIMLCGFLLLTGMLLWQVFKPTIPPAQPSTPAAALVPVAEQKAVAPEKRPTQKKKVKRTKIIDAKSVPLPSTSQNIPEPSLIPPPNGTSLGDHPELLEFFTGS